MYACIYTYMYIYTHVYMYEQLYIYIYIYPSVYAHIYIYISCIEHGPTSWEGLAGQGNVRWRQAWVAWVAQLHQVRTKSESKETTCLS